MKWVWLFVGGGCGAALRIALAQWVDQRAGPPFPWGTFAVNALGCFAVGLLATLSDELRWIPPHARFFAVAGLLGGFTTFSTFGLETWRLVEEGRALLALGNALASVVGGLVAVIAGVVLGRAIG